jgi:HSP20 family protein
MKVFPWRKRDGITTYRTDLDELFDRFMEPFASEYTNRLPAVFQQRGTPAMNVAETENEFLVTLELPGLEEKDITVELMGKQLIVSGDRKWEKEEKKGKEFHRVESQYGTFQRSLTLPEGLRLEHDAVTATFKKGILEVRVPKLEPTPAAKITVTAG